MLGDVQGWMRRQKSPVTVFLIASLIVSSLALWMLKLKGIDQISLAADSPSRPWSFFTYPWAYMPLADGLELMFFVFLLMWMWWLGRDLEGEMGSFRFAGMWLLLTFLGGLFMWIGWKVVGVAGVHGAPYIPEAALTVAWCARHPSQSVMLYGVLPVQGRWLAALTAITMLLLFGFPAPLLGVAAILNEGVAALWALEKIPFLPFAGGPSFSVRKEKEVPAARGGRVYDEKYYDEVRRREQDRQERERLRKLLGEGPDDDDGPVARK
jgi:hypothetical protein